MTTENFLLLGLGILMLSTGIYLLAVDKLTPILDEANKNPVKGKDGNIVLPISNALAQTLQWSVFGMIVGGALTLGSAGWGLLNLFFRALVG